ncbi:hypothetical protein BpHYR1_041348 [Brachionus plicatilis]|uniref:Uncharacterized protein n=1 Tax=Brachionus plicatilis TaxID=10195 RepID=A0A3M7PM47_BRAPC|nr:hypothetical protein BpHYR1_041348 [Brachionus plicatilis]
MIIVLKRLFLVTLSLTTISIIIYFTLIPTELDNFAFQTEFIIENELIYGENNDKKYYNRSFEGFNEFYIKNLKKTIDYTSIFCSFLSSKLFCECKMVHQLSKSTNDVKIALRLNCIFEK